MLDYAKKNNLKYNILIWNKTNAPPLINNTFVCDIEYIVFIHDTGIKLNGSYEDLLKVYRSTTNQEDKKKYNHPTIKPIQLIMKFIKIASKENDVILDCFMGSGTTGVASIKLNRNFIGIEKENKYFQIAKDRIETEINKYNVFDFI